MGRVNGEDSRVNWPWTLAAHNGNVLDRRNPHTDHCIFRLRKTLLDLQGPSLLR